MLDWFKRRRALASRQHETAPQAAKPQGRAMSGQYQLLYKYLENRYADTVVLARLAVLVAVLFRHPREPPIAFLLWVEHSRFAISAR